MGKWWMIAAAVVLLAGGALAALVLTGTWPGPSEADRAQARTHFTEAQAALEAGNQDAALEALNASIDLAPQNDSLRTRASIYIARNDIDAALRDYDKILRRSGALAADYSTRCWLRARGEDLNGARNDCNRAIEMSPQLAGAFGNRGLVGLRQNRNPEAWEDFNTALRLGGSDEWVAWRLFGRGLAAVGKGSNVEGRQDIETAIRTKPTVPAEFAAFGVGNEVMAEYDDAAYAAAIDPRSLETLQHYLAVYPNGRHVAEAQQEVAAINAWIAEDIAAGRAALPGFNLSQVRGPGAGDSFGAMAISRSTWRIAFSTDYGDPMEAMVAAQHACNGTAVRDCDAFAFRNVCAAMALSRAERARGMAWAYAQDDAVRGSISQCRARGGRNCMPVHVQCTPTPTDSTPAASAE